MNRDSMGKMEIHHGKKTMVSMGIQGKPWNTNSWEMERGATRQCPARCCRPLANFLQQTIQLQWSSLSTPALGQSSHFCLVGDKNTSQVSKQSPLPIWSCSLSSPLTSQHPSQPSMITDVLAPLVVSWLHPLSRKATNRSRSMDVNGVPNGHGTGLKHCRTSSLSKSDLHPTLNQDESHLPLF